MVLYRFKKEKVDIIIRMPFQFNRLMGESINVESALNLNALKLMENTVFIVGN